MRFESFLENLYFADFKLSGHTYFEADKNDPAVSEITAKYLEIVKDNPAARIESAGRVPDELINKLKKIGFFGLIIPKEYGGVGLTLFQYLALVRELVKTDMALGVLSLAHLSIGMKPILLYGNAEQKKKYLTQAAGGEMIFCYALTEPLIGSDAKNIDTVAELSSDGSHYIINGSKAFITNANYSGGLTVFAQLDKTKKGRLGAFIVETKWEGVTIGKDVEKMGLTASSTASIQFKNVKVPRENLIGKEGDGFKIAMTVLNYGRLALGAASAGMLDASYSDMLKRANSRIQFERPIFDFELIQEKIVKALVESEAVWAMTCYTAGILEKNPIANAAVESSHCKLYGTNRAWETLYDAMQTAGGSGYLKTNPYEKRMRDFRVAPIFEGTTEIHSIYPPILILRNIGKHIMPQGRMTFTGLLKLAALYFKPSLWIINGRNRLIKKALKAVKIYSKYFRKIMIKSMMKYGKNVIFREFLLRRLTTISCRIYAIITMVLKLRELDKKNADAERLENALSYFLESSKKTVKENRNIKPDILERKLNMIVGFIRKKS